MSTCQQKLCGGEACAYPLAAVTASRLDMGQRRQYRPTRAFMAMHAFLLSSALHGAASFLMIPAVAKPHRWPVSRARHARHSVRPHTLQYHGIRDNKRALPLDSACAAGKSKNVQERRQFSAQLLEALTSGTNTSLQYPDAVNMWLEPPQVNPDERTALAALLAYAISRRGERGISSGALAIPGEFLTAPFLVPRIGPARKCQLCRDTSSRAFDRAVLDSFFKRLFLHITEACRTGCFDVRLSPYDLFHCHLLLLDTPGGPRLAGLFHVREYPRYHPDDFPLHLGHCQEGSTVQSLDGHRRNILWVDAASGKQSAGRGALLAVLNTEAGGTLQSELVFPGLEPLATIFEDDLGALIADLICVESDVILSALANAVTEDGRAAMSTDVSFRVDRRPRYAAVEQRCRRDRLTLLVDALPAHMLAAYQRRGGKEFYKEDA